MRKAKVPNKGANTFANSNSYKQMMVKDGNYKFMNKSTLI